MDFTINWHITEKCNYSCKYCFAKGYGCSELWKYHNRSSKVLNSIIDFNNSNYYRQIKKRYDSSKIRVNFVGGEPLILGKRLETLVKDVNKKDLKASLVTNGSLLKNNYNLIPYLDTIGISIDSFKKETNIRIGSHSNNEFLTLEQLRKIVFDIRNINESIKIKFNTVVSQYNYKERIITDLLKLKPDKIKIFQILPVNTDESISDNDFNFFLENNMVNDYDNINIETSENMVNSYIMVDPSGRLFQNNINYGYDFGSSLLDVTLENALKLSKFDIEKYDKRYRNGNNGKK